MPPRPNGPRLSMKESMKQLDKKTLFRLLSYMKPYRLHLVFVFICIAVSAFASVMSSLFLKSLIDDYISPLLLESNPELQRPSVCAAPNGSHLRHRRVLYAVLQPHHGSCFTGHVKENS